MVRMQRTTGSTGIVRSAMMVRSSLWRVGLTGTTVTRRGRHEGRPHELLFKSPSLSAKMFYICSFRHSPRLLLPQRHDNPSRLASACPRMGPPGYGSRPSNPESVGGSTAAEIGADNSGADLRQGEHKGRHLLRGTLISVQSCWHEMQCRADGRDLRDDLRGTRYPDRSLLWWM